MRTLFDCFDIKWLFAYSNCIRFRCVSCTLCALNVSHQKNRLFPCGELIFDHLHLVIYFSSIRTHFQCVFFYLCGLFFLCWRTIHKSSLQQNWTNSFASIEIFWHVLPILPKRQEKATFVHIYSTCTTIISARLNVGFRIFESKTHQRKNGFA